MKGISMRQDRSIQWCEKQLIQVLKQKKVVRTYCALSELVLKKVRSVDESRNLNKAIMNLVVTRQVQKTKDRRGVLVYRLMRTNPEA
jgi:hypothetical protein